MVRQITREVLESYLLRKVRAHLKLAAQVPGSGSGTRGHRSRIPERIGQDRQTVERPFVVDRPVLALACR